MGDIANTLNIDVSAIVINIIGFVLLIFIANSMVFKPIGRVIDERKQDIDQTYDTLDTDRRQMDELRQDYERRLAEIEAQAREKIQSAIKDAQAARDQILSEATDRSRELVARAEREAERERQEAMVTLRRQIVDLALGATAKVIGDGMDENRQRQLIDNFITSGGGSLGPASAVATATPITTNPETAPAAEKPAAKPRRTTAKNAAAAADAPADAAPAAPEAEA